MTKLKLLIIIFSTSFSCLAQTNDSVSLSYWTPKSWFSGDKKLLRDNLNKYKFTEDQMNQLVNEIRTTKVLGIYYKYDKDKHYGFIPTMKFYLHQNSSEDFESFFLYLTNEIEKVKSIAVNFKYIENPTTILIGKRKAFYASATYNLKVQTGELASIRTKFIGIPFGKKFLHVTLLDNEDEDCTDLYKEVISKINVE